MPAGAIPFPFGECRICADKATGVHYGVETCEGCKGFFKRSIVKGEKYKCFFGRLCVLSPQNRNRCKACRYHRCLHFGMSVEAVKMGRIPKVDKERALQEYRQKIQNIPRTQNYMQETNNYLKYNSHSNISQIQQGQQGFFMNASSPRQHNTTSQPIFYGDNGYSGTVYQGLDSAYQGLDPVYQGLDPAYQGVDPAYNGPDSAESHVRDYHANDIDVNNNNNNINNNNNNNNNSHINNNNINNNNNNSISTNDNNNNNTSSSLVVNFKQEPLDQDEIDYQNNSMKHVFESGNLAQQTEMSKSLINNNIKSEQIYTDSMYKNGSPQNNMVSSTTNDYSISPENSNSDILSPSPYIPNFSTSILEENSPLDSESSAGNMDDSYDKNEFDQYLFPSHEVTLCTVYSHVDSKPPENLLATPPTTPSVAAACPASPGDARSQDGGPSRTSLTLGQQRSSQIASTTATTPETNTTQSNLTIASHSSQQHFHQHQQHLHHHHHHNQQNNSAAVVAQEVTLVTSPTTPTIPCFVMTTNAYAKFLDLVENNSNNISSQETRVGYKKSEIMDYWKVFLQEIPIINDIILGICNDLDDFKKLTSSDRFKLMEAAYFDIWVIVSAGQMSLQKGNICTPRGMVLSKKLLLHFFRPSLLNELLKCAEYINNMQFGPYEVSFISAIRMCDPDRAHLEDRDQVCRITSVLRSRFGDSRILGNLEVMLNSLSPQLATTVSSFNPDAPFEGCTKYI